MCAGVMCTGLLAVVEESGQQSEPHAQQCKGGSKRGGVQGGSKAHLRCTSQQLGSHARLLCSRCALDIRSWKLLQALMTNLHSLILKPDT